METKIELLDNTAHKNLCVDTSRLDSQHHQVNNVFVNINELSNLVHEYPIFITKNSHTGQFQLVALLGFDAGENLYINNGQWNARHLPMDILRHPFHVKFPDNNPQSSGKIALDENSVLLLSKESTTKGKPIFNADGEPTDYLLRAQEIIKQLMSGAQASRKTLQQLQQYGLLMPVTLDITLHNNTQIPLAGYYGIDENKLAQLSGKDLEDCHRQGYLQLCYLILSSAINLEKLIYWKSSKISETEKK